jgi:putative DNA primase/helicase
VPDDAPPCKFKDPELGKPTKLYAYRDTEGALLMYEARWDYTGANGEKKKRIYPLTYCDLGNGKRGWRAKAV